MARRAPTCTSADRPRAALVLGHGAGGGVTAPDLVAATDAALLGRGQRRARRAALPRRRSTRTRSGAPARSRVDGRRRPPAGRRAAGIAARRGRPVPGRPGGLSHRRIDGRRRGPVPRLSAPAAAPVRRSRRAEPPTRARWRGGADAGRAGRARPVRHAAREPPSHGRAGAGQPQPANRRRSGGCRGPSVAAPTWWPVTTRRRTDRAGRARGSRLGARCPRESRRRRPGTQPAAPARAWRDPRPTRPRSSSA